MPDSRLQAEARDLWRNTDKKEKKKWLKMLEPQRQRYIEAYTSETKFCGSGIRYLFDPWIRDG